MIQDNITGKVEIRKGYYNSGALKSVTPYVYENIHGVEKYYYETGALWWEAPYENGKRHGILRNYYATGALWWETPFVNGVQHGIERRYDKDKTNIRCLTLYDKDHEVTSIKI